MVYLNVINIVARLVVAGTTWSVGDVSSGECATAEHRHKQWLTFCPELCVMTPAPYGTCPEPLPMPQG